MSYDGWLSFAGVEISNLARTSAYASALGVETSWVNEGDLDWIRVAHGDAPYTSPQGDLVSWYDVDNPASAEFAGISVLSAAGLGDSSLTSQVVEYISDGGNPGRARNTTQTIVFSVALFGSTDRGAEYGLRWLKNVLRQEGCLGGTSQFCSGSDLAFYRYRYQGNTALDPVTWARDALVHYRNVRVTVGPTVTRRRVSDCSSTIIAQFTVVAGDPYQYGEPYKILDGLGVGTPTYAAPYSGDSGSTALTESTCPVYDYSPLYDPSFPVSVAPPPVPDFLPDGWTIADGDSINRFWAEIPASAIPDGTRVVPLIVLNSPGSEVRMVRLRLYDPATTSPADICTPLWEAVVTYIPGVGQLTIDGEQSACYYWDGTSPQVRRADSLVYSANGRPLEWISLSCPGALRLVIDAFDGSTTFPPTSFSLVPKGD